MKAPETNRVEQQCLSVGQLASLLNATLEEHVGALWFEGEISEVKRHASGHLYFTVKDKDAQISAVMWQSYVAALKFNPIQGSQVRCWGKANIFAKMGRFQMVVARMIPSGEGLLRKKFLELKAKLEKEGLFSESRKRKLPFLPRAIGLVTSASGAALHDMWVKLRERMPQIPVYLVDVRVQGEGAAADIASGIKFLSESALVDVMIVGRGGGSLEDLWAFNEEAVVRAIFASNVPVISAVGHEVDTSLSDLAADWRAPTPTAAAECVVPRREDLFLKLAELGRRLGDYERWFSPLSQLVDELSATLSSHLGAYLKQQSLLVDRAEISLKSIEPKRIIELLSSRISMAEGRLQQRLLHTAGIGSQALTRQEARLARTLPREKFSMMNDRVNSMEARMNQGTARSLENFSRALEGLSARVTASNPKGILERGYAIVRSEKGIVRDASKVESGESLEVAVARGGFKVRVEAAS